MNPKIKKIDKEYAKNAEKISELQARQVELEKQRTELENLDIIGLVRNVGLTPDQLAAVLKALQGGLFPSLAAMPGAGAPGMQAGRDNNTSEIKEDKEHEDQ